MPRLFVLDAMALAYRAYYALARWQIDANGDRVPVSMLNTKDNEPTNAIYGFANVALMLRREEQPDLWALAWDGPGPTFRHEAYAEYKADRKPIPPDLLAQLGALEDVAQAIGLPVIEVPGMEADDVMGTLARRGERDGLEVALVTGDKDMLQLVNDRIKVLNPGMRGTDYRWVDRDAVHAEWGVAPEQLRDVLALMGDTIDNVPGVKGIGKKTAVELISTYGSLDALFERVSEIRKPALRQKLETSRDQAFMSRDLVTIRTDCEVPYTWDDLRCGPLRREALLQLARRYELIRLERIALEEGVSDADAGARTASRAAGRRGTSSKTPLPEMTFATPAPPRVPEPAPVPPPMSAQVAPAGTLDLFSAAAAGPDGEARALAQLDQQIASLDEVRARAIHGLAILPVADGDDPRQSTLVGLALAARDGTAAYLPIAHALAANLPLERVREWLQPALVDGTARKVGEDLKRDAHVLERAGLSLRGLSFDLHVVSFLCDPARDHSLDALARDVLGQALPPLAPVPATRGKPRPGLASLPIEVAGAAALARVRAMFPIADALKAQLESREQWELYDTLERPLIPVLLEMERAGVAVDRGVLETMRERFAAELERLSAELTALAGEPINLESGQQLARVLFEKLGLKAGRRTKTGWSTDRAVLEELAAEHAFPRLLLDYRTLAKLQSTYLDALPAQIDPRDGRVHTTYNQAGAATGRLSSSNPNLQNIPFRTEAGRAIRRAFVAPPGWMLVGADYSQIELRIMAHLSGDPQLIDAFHSGEDVHATTARRVFGIGAGALDPALRARAKIVNYGVMYGMGPRSLSSQMEIPLAEAEAFIREYFKVYARVRAYLDDTLEDARQRGFVQTLLGRRRYLPGLASTHGAERSLSERAAINTPIQGSAADLMKLAMVRVQRALKRDRPSARLLLQVHDELLVECPADEADAVAEVVRTEMEGCFPLQVPLEVSTGRGATWLDVH